MTSLPATPGVLPAIGTASTALQWRGPWWLWQLLALAVASLLAPPLLVTAGLLARDPRSDHPAFWLGLIAIVPLGNLFAAAVVNHMHHRHPFSSRHRVVAAYAAASLLAGSIGFTWLGWETGFLADILAVFGQRGGLFDAVAVLASLSLSVAYGALAFFHAGAVYAWIVFTPCPEGFEAG